MRCENCGVEMVAGAAFCPSCGKPARSVLATAPGGTQAPTIAAPGLQINVAGALCYLLGLITGIFFLVADPYKRDHFVRFHAFQSIFLSVACFVVYFVLSILLAILPRALWRAAWFLESLLGLGFFLLWLFLMFKAYSDEEFQVPFIGELAAKQA